MPFDLDTWKTAVRTRLTAWQPRFVAAGVNSVYGFVAAASLWPAIEAWQRNPVEALPALMSVITAVGTNLWANQLQNLKDETDLAQRLTAAVADPKLQAELDHALEQLHAVEAARTGLAAQERDWFIQELQAELQRLGNLPRYSAVLTGDNNALAQDNSQAAAWGGVAADTINAPVSTGAYGRSIQAGLYAEHLHLGDASNPPPPASVQPDPLHRYLDKLITRCNALPLAALGGESSAGAEVRLDNVYIALDTTAKVKLKADPKQPKGADNLPVEMNRDRERPYAALEAAVEYQRLVLLGDPGSGKSSFVQHLAAWLAAVQLGLAAEPLPAGYPSGLLPLLVTLRDVAAALDAVLAEKLARARQNQKLVGILHEHWRSQLATCDAATAWPRIEQALEAGKVLLVFDGLDEMPRDQRRGVWSAVAALADEYRRIQRMIVTCRTRSYDERLALDGFVRYELAPLDEPKIRGFIAAWYRTRVALDRLAKAREQGMIDDLQQAALDVQIVELSSNPMLLTAMAIIHQRGTGLPRQRVRLYAEAVKVLIQRWQAERDLQVVPELKKVLDDDDRLLPILEHVAYAAHDQRVRSGKTESADLTRAALLALLEQDDLLGDAGLAAKFLDYIDQRAGILVGRGGSDGGSKPELYSFPHRTFQEYLAGCSLLSARPPEAAFLQHAGEGEFWHLAAKFALEEQRFSRRSPALLDSWLLYFCPEKTPVTEAGWRLGLWAGHLASLDDPAQWAGRSFATVDGVLTGAAMLGRLQKRLLAIMRDSPLPAVDRAEAGRLLAQLGDSRIEVMDPLHIELLPVPAGEFLIGDRREKLDIPYDFKISRYPITNVQFDEFVEAGGYAEAKYWREAQQEGFWKAGQVKFWQDEEWRNTHLDAGSPFNLANHPVVAVTWYEALAFTRWLNDELHRHRPDKLPKDWCLRLPTEAEWEKAARGREGWEYPWGPDADPNRANYDATNIRSTSAVGCFPGGHSPYDAEEMAGNVWEWTSSLYQQYPYSAGDGRENLAAPSREARVLRGGSYYLPADGVRGASRLRGGPYGGFANIGFRVLASPFTSGLCPSGR